MGPVSLRGEPAKLASHYGDGYGYGYGYGYGSDPATKILAIQKAA